MKTLGFLPPDADITPAIPSLGRVFDMALAGRAQHQLQSCLPPTWPE